MRIVPIRELLEHQAVFDGMGDADLDLVAGCGRNEVVVPGAVVAREGDGADRFFVVRTGRLALELAGRGRTLRIDTAGPGDVVGWSWIFPPYRWSTDIVAVEHSRVVAIDGSCLRAKSEADPAFGYRTMKRFAEVLTHQLDATRLQLLDVYGDG